MWNWTKSKLSDATEVARYAIFGCLVVIITMWLINISGYQVLNGLFGFIGLVLVIFLTLSPKVIQPSAALTGLITLLSRGNPVSGALAGPLWIVSIAKSFLYGFLFFATFLTFWSFENSPWAFWGVFLVAIMLFIWRERYGSMGNWGKWIEWAYILICGGALLLSTFGDPWNGRSFDPTTGAALHMVDPTTGKVDSLARTPSQCASQPCFSEESGAQLVPMNQGQAVTRNVTAYPGMVLEGITTTTGMPGWLIVLIIGGVATVIYFWSDKRVKPVIMAAALLGVGWAGYTYAWPAVAAATVGCPGTFNAGDERILLRQGCTTEVTGFRQGNLLQVMDGRFDGDLNQYLDMPQPFAGYLRLTPNSGWPAGSETVEVRVVTPAQAARATPAQPDTIVLDVSNVQ